MLNNANEFKYIHLKDNSKNRLIRGSCFTRIVLGTFFTTSSCFVYALIFARLKKLDRSFINNYIKGSLLLSLGFFSLNESLYSASKYCGIYSNFFLNYSLTSYIMSRKFYKYLIRNNHMQWDKAIKFSHKCFLFFCVIVSSLELYVYLYREIQLYDGEDIFDYFEKNMRDSNQPVSFKEIENNFMSSFHILNNPEKRKLIDAYINDSNDPSKKYKTFNLYKYFRDQNKYL